MTIDQLIYYTPGERLALFKATLQKLATIWITNQHKGVIAKDLSEAEIKLFLDDFSFSRWAKQAY